MAERYTQGHYTSNVEAHTARNAVHILSPSIYRNILKPLGKQLGFFIAYSKLDSTILDVGCGPGTITSSLTILIPSGHCTGTDSSTAVIEKAREQQSLPSNCSDGICVWLRTY